MVIVGVVALTTLAPTPVRAQPSISTACANFYLSSSAGEYAMGGRAAGADGVPYPGETFTVTATLATGTWATIALMTQTLPWTILDGPASVPTTLTWTVPASGPPPGMTDIMWWAVDGSEDAYIDIQASCTPAPAPGPDPVAPVPGCDVRMGLPTTSVVGSFLSDALLYAEPGVSTSPALTLSAGKTAWVLGEDASGGYYKILWVCDYLWVKKGTLGPNPDAVWQGRPLPTNVVQ